MCVFMGVSTPASQHYLLQDYNNAFTATVAADLQSKHFCCFPNHRNKRRTKKTCDVFNVCSDLHVKGMMMAYASTH